MCKAVGPVLPCYVPHPAVPPLATVAPVLTASCILDNVRQCSVVVETRDLEPEGWL